MTDGMTDSPGPASQTQRRGNDSRDPADNREYSARLAALGRFTLRHKALVIGAWLGTAVVLALLFPQLETVVRQQSVDLIPRDAPSLQTVERMSTAFGEEGSKTLLFVAMEDPNGLTPAARQRYDELVARLQSASLVIDGQPHFTLHDPRLQGEGMGVRVDLQVGWPAANEDFVIAFGKGLGAVVVEGEAGHGLAPYRTARAAA